MFVSASGAIASEDKIGVIAKNAAVSPSGHELVFAADYDGKSRLWVSGLDGSRLRKVSAIANSAAATNDLEPAWSPDGRKIAYTSLEGTSSNIWVVQADGAYPFKLTTNGASNGHPAWSPDGRKIAFESDKDGTNDIWMMNVDGTQQLKLVNSPGQESSPTFSPTGDRIVFSKTEGDGTILMIVNVDGTGLRPLTTGNQRDWDPSWGARGILFSSNRSSSSGDFNIWVVQPDGSNLHKLADTDALDPKWLPDGRIVFTDTSMASKALAAVSILNPATGEKRVVVDVQGYMTPIDIRPGKASNQIHPKSMGKLQVAILSTRNFDATKAVIQKSITFGRTGDESSLASCSKSFRDVNGDGLPDLTCRFWMRYAGFQMGNTVGVLRFMHARGVTYEGRDVVTTVVDDDPEDLKD